MIALAADLTRDEVRTRAMAAIGMTIGATFALSLVVGTGARRRSSACPGIFVLTGVLALGAIARAASTARAATPTPPVARLDTPRAAGSACSPTASSCVSTTASSRCTRC